MSLQGWRKSVVFFTCSNIVALVINLTFVLSTVLRGRRLSSDGSYILHEASTNKGCTRLKQLNIGTHLIINLLSTLILAGSNFCMQCLSAPTRSEVCHAHSSGKYLDIGVPSVRNLKHISARRVWLWIALGLSSWPLHLFYNSAIYASTSSNNYFIFSTGSSFVEGGSMPPFRVATFYDEDEGSWSPNFNEQYWQASANYSQEEFDIARRAQSVKTRNQFANLTSRECISAYTQPFQAKFRNLVMVTDNDVNSTLYQTELNFAYDISQPFDWMCAYMVRELYPYDYGVPCNQIDLVARMNKDASEDGWKPFGDSVKYCLAQRSDEKCRLLFNLPVAATVVGLNFLKLCLMVCVFLLAFRSSQTPLLTLGDTVKSFLQEYDPTTRSHSLLTRHEVIKESTPESLLKYLGTPQPRPYKPKPNRWVTAVSGRRWAFCITLYIASLVVVFYWLDRGLKNMSSAKDLKSLWNAGIGTVTGPSGGNTMIISHLALRQSPASQILKWVFLANLPQLVFSLLYYTYNGLFTAMLMAHEWNTYSTKRKGLRVVSTRPIGEQRGTYFLQLPYRWSIPLIGLSTLLHWLISQSLFLVDIDMIDFLGAPVVKRNGNVGGNLRTLGYSPMAIILVILVGVLLLLAVIMVASRRFQTGMPVAGSNSMAITAACHLPHDLQGGRAEADVATLKLQWGVMTLEHDHNNADNAAAVSTTSLVIPHSPLCEVRQLGTKAQSVYKSIELASHDTERSRKDSVLVQNEEILADTVSNGAATYRQCGFSSGKVEAPNPGHLYL